jgi:hypothetical protein
MNQKLENLTDTQMGVIEIKKHHIKKFENFLLKFEIFGKKIKSFVNNQSFKASKMRLKLKF